MFTITLSDVETFVSHQDQYIALFGEAEYFRIMNGLRTALGGRAQFGGDL